MKVASRPCALAAALTARFKSSASSAAPDRVGAVLQIDLELAGTGFLHDGVDRKTLRVAESVDVVDEGRQRSRARRSRRSRAVRDRRRGHPGAGSPKGAVPRALGDVEFELDSRGRRLPGVAREAARPGRRARRAGSSSSLTSTIMTACARLPSPTGIGTNVPAAGGIDGRDRRSPKGGRSRLNAIAERVHDEDRARHHQAALGDAGKIGSAHALAARNAVHVEEEGVDPLHARMSVEKRVGLVDGEPGVAHVRDASRGRAEAAEQRSSKPDSPSPPHSGCHCTPRQKASSSGPRTASTRPSSA